MLRRALERSLAIWRGWVGHPDPRVEAANTFALVVASNQPFYPLYLLWLVSGTVWPTLVTFLSTPFFAAVPIVARRHPLAARALLPLAGLGNTVACAWAFGTASGVEIFLVPCLILALLPFRPSERMVSFPIAALVCGAYLVLHTRYGPPLHVYGAAEYEAFVRLNISSAMALTFLVALRFAGLVAETPER